jgi:hypothetical protein
MTCQKEACVAMALAMAWVLAGCSPSQLGQQSADAVLTPAALPARDNSSKPNEPWVEFKFAELFAAQAPSAPECDEDDLGHGVKAVSCSVEGKGLVMLAMATSLPSKPLEAAAIDKALALAVESAAKSMKGNVSKVEPAYAAGAKGRDFSVKTPEGEVHGRVLIAGGMLAQALAMPKAETDATKKEAQRFIASLVFKPAP